MIMEIYNGTCCVYMHTNKINGKKYVGQTKMKPEERWKNGKGYKTCVLFYRAIQKYGWENFEHEVIASNLTKEEADNFEKLLIEQLNLINPDKGYNLKEGGSKGNFSESSKIKMRENHADFSGKNNPQYGKKHTEETKMKISLAKIGHKGYRAPDYVIQQLTEWTKNHSGGDSPIAKAIAQYDLNENLIKEWDCIVSASKTLCIDASSISKACNGKRKTAGGFIWKYTIQN